MDHATVFDVNVHDLGRLNAEQAVDVLRQLLWAEASAVGIAKNLINVPTSIDAKDGGVDADIRDAPTVSGQGIIKPGITRYQVKTGKFSLKGERYIRNILLRKGASKYELTSDDLKPRVKACFDKGGTLVVVLFGSDNPDPVEDATAKAFQKLLKTISSTYETAKIEICRQNQIIAFLKPFPSISLLVNRRDIGGGMNHSEWADRGDNRAHYEAGPSQKKAIEDLQAGLRNTDSAALHIRLLGEAGGRKDEARV